MEDKENKEKKSKKGAALRVLRWVLVVIVLILGIYLVMHYVKQQANTQKMESVKETVTEPEDDTDDNELDIDWDQLHETNKDIYAWIYIPDTEVNYPILQSDEYTDTDYYLDHNLDGTEGLPGCIYTQKLNSTDFEDRVTVVYGHDMKNGSMFRALHDYQDRDFFDANPYIYIYTPDYTYTYQIYAAYRSDNSLILGKYALFQDLAVYEDFLNTVVSQEESDSLCHINQDVEVSGEDKTLILSTCIGNDDYRYLVQAKQVDAKAKNQ
jgi:sortase B